VSGPSGSVVAFRNKARLLKRAMDKGDPETVSRVGRVLGLVPQAFGLVRAQQVVALEHGFTSWNELLSASEEDLQAALKARAAGQEKTP
jgi:hypothetical protein